MTSLTGIIKTTAMAVKNLVISGVCYLFAFSASAVDWDHWTERRQQEFLTDHFKKGSFDCPANDSKWTLAPSAKVFEKDQAAIRNDACQIRVPLESQQLLAVKEYMISGAIHGARVMKQKSDGVVVRRKYGGITGSVELESEVKVGLEDQQLAYQRLGKQVQGWGVAANLLVLNALAGLQKLANGFLFKLETQIKLKPVDLPDSWIKDVCDENILTGRDHLLFMILYASSNQP